MHTHTQTHIQTYSPYHVHMHECMNVFVFFPLNWLIMYICRGDENSTYIKIPFDRRPTEQI